MRLRWAKSISIFFLARRKVRWTSSHSCRARPDAPARRSDRRTDSAERVILRGVPSRELVEQVRLLDPTLALHAPVGAIEADGSDREPDRKTFGIQFGGLPVTMLMAMTRSVVAETVDALPRRQITTANSPAGQALLWTATLGRELLHGP